MKNYQTFEEIDQHLKLLKLERMIALEKIKLTKNELKEDLKPANWVITMTNIAGKYGFYILLKRFFR